LFEGASPQRKAVAPLTLLPFFYIWSERNARIFRNKYYLSFVILEKIKVEVRVIAGAKKLNSVTRESRLYFNLFNFLIKSELLLSY
jgi:hypothetical protein